MTKHDSLKWLPAALIFVSLLAIAPGTPVAWAGEPLEVSVHAGGEAVTWAPAEGGEFLLRVSLPSGKVVERRGLGSLRIDGRAVPGRRWADGVYVWEVISMSAGAGGEQRPPATGSFRVSGASFHLAADRPEAEAEPRARATEDQTVPDDLIVDGKACLGLGCATGEGFLGEALRLKQANALLRFEDTSGAGLASRDWQIRINEPVAGAEKFSIEDLTAGTVPFTVRGGAPSNSLFVDAVGNVGSGTGVPAADLHLSGAAAQTVRFEKTGAPARTWDLAADNTSFRVVDVTNGSAVPLQVAAGAPTNSIVVGANGQVGIGVASDPAFPLKIQGNTTDATVRVRNTNPLGYSGITFYDHNGADGVNGFFFGLSNAGQYTRFNSVNNFPFVFLTNGNEKVRILTNGNVGIGTPTPQGKLDVNGTIYQRGVPIHADHVFADDYSLESIEQHAASMWKDRHLPAVPARTVDDEGREVIEIGADRQALLVELEKAHIYIQQLHERLAKVEALLERP